MSKTVKSLTNQDFAELIGETFEIEFTEGSFTNIELTDVSEVNESQNQTSFSIVFLAPNDAPTIGASYNLKNEKLGSLAIYLSPFHKDENGVNYEAIFSRLKE